MSFKAVKAIRRFCLDCQGGYAPSVRDCLDYDCSLYPLRLAEAETPGGRPALRVIRVYCLACAGSRQDARACEAKDSCALWSFRFGVQPETFRRVTARLRERRRALKLPGLV